MIKFKYEYVDKTLKGVCRVRLDNRKVLCAQGAWTKHFERFFVVQ